MEVLGYKNGIVVYKKNTTIEEINEYASLNQDVEIRLVSEVNKPTSKNENEYVNQKVNLINTPHLVYGQYLQAERVYTVVPFTIEEIESRVLEISESNKKSIIQAETEKQIIATAQAGNDSDALDNADVFPVWSEEGVAYALDYKVKSFDGAELKLYKCVQAHTSQAGWEPINVPALFTRVAYPNEILVFVQPTGAQDAYALGDKVYFPTENDDIYESLIADNVYSPTAYPAGWQIQ
jgi:hypothetical protein